MGMGRWKWEKGLLAGWFKVVEPTVLAQIDVNPERSRFGEQEWHLIQQTSQTRRLCTILANPIIETVFHRVL